MRLLCVAMALFMIGLLTSYCCADYQDAGQDIMNKVQVMWTRLYYIWAKTCDLLVWASVASIVKKYVLDKEVAKALYLLVGFQFCRLLWEVFSIETGTDVNHPKYIFLLFVLLIITICSVLAIPFLKKEKWEQY